MRVSIRRRSCLGLLLIIILLLNAFVGQVQATVEVMPSLDLAMPNPYLFANDTGEVLVAAQWFPEKFTYRGETFENSLIRVAVIDLKTCRQIARKDFGTNATTFAVGRNELYVLNFANNSIKAVSFDLQRERLTTSFPHSRSEYQVVANQLLCSVDGKGRFDIPSLTVSKFWRPLEDPKIANREMLLIRPLFGGWYVDGVIYDRDLRQAQWIPGPESIHYQFRGQKPFDPAAEKDLTWNITADFPKLEPGLSLCGMIHSEFPAAFELTIPPADESTGEIPVTVQLKQIGGEILDSRVMGSIPSIQVSSRNGKEYIWDSGQIIAPAYRNPMTVSIRRAGRSDVVAAQWAGNRICTVIGGFLKVWEVDPALLKSLKSPVGLHPQLPAVFIEYDQLTKIPITPPADGLYEFSLQGAAGSLLSQHGGALSLSKDGTFSIHFRLYQTLLRRESVSQLLKQIGIGRFEDVSLYVNSLRPLVERTLGRPLRGVPWWEHFAFTAQPTAGNQSRQSYSYWVLTEFPDEVVKKSFQRPDDIVMPANPSQDMIPTPVAKNANRPKKNTSARRIKEPKPKDDEKVATISISKRTQMYANVDDRLGWTIFFAQIGLFIVIPAAALTLVAFSFTSKSKSNNGKLAVRPKPSVIWNVMSGVGIAWGSLIIISFFARGANLGQGNYAVGMTVGLTFGLAMIVLGSYYLSRRE